MDVIQAIYSRRAIRTYKSDQVSKEILNKLLEAATLAPSASNIQPWAFAIIQNKEMLKKYSDKAKILLLQLMGNNPDPQGYKATLSNPEFNIFYNAGTLVVVYTNTDRSQATGDCCLAAQNLMLTAHSLGLGTCWIGFSLPLLNNADFKQEIGIPLTYKAVAPVIVGYPEVTPSTYSRKPPEILIWK